jgi:hypothetical protein
MRQGLRIKANSPLQEAHLLPSSYHRAIPSQSFPHENFNLVTDRNSLARPATWLAEKVYCPLGKALALGHQMPSNETERAVWKYAGTNVQVSCLAPESMSRSAAEKGPGGGGWSEEW